MPISDRDAVTHSRIRYVRGDIDKRSRIWNGRLCLFGSRYLLTEAEDKWLLQSRNTRLGQALGKAGTAYRALDFNENELYETGVGTPLLLLNGNTASGKWNSGMLF